MTKAGIIIYYTHGSNIFILVGKTGFWLSDDKAKKEKIKELEMAKDYPDYHFLSTAYNLSVEYNKKIHFTDIFFSENEDCYRTNFVILKYGKSKITIPKGTHEINDKNTFNTAIRETFEETGFEIQRQNELKDISSKNDKDKFYIYKLTKEEKKLIDTIIEDRNKGYFGELFDLQFLNLSDIDKNELNPFTIKAIENFQKFYDTKLLKVNAKPFIPK